MNPQELRLAIMALLLQHRGTDTMPLREVLAAASQIEQFVLSGNVPAEREPKP